MMTKFSFVGELTLRLMGMVMVSFYLLGLVTPVFQNKSLHIRIIYPLILFSLPPCISISLQHAYAK